MPTKVLGDRQLAIYDGPEITKGHASDHEMVHIPSTSTELGGGKNKTRRVNKTIRNKTHRNRRNNTNKK